MINKNQCEINLFFGLTELSKSEEEIIIETLPSGKLKFFIFFLIIIYTLKSLKVISVYLNPKSKA